MKYKFSKIAPTQIAQFAQRNCTATQTERIWTEENVIVVDELVLSQQDQPLIYRSVHQMAKTGVICIIFCHGDLGLKCLKKSLLKNWLKQTCIPDIAA